MWYDQCGSISANVFCHFCRWIEKLSREVDSSPSLVRRLANRRPCKLFANCEFAVRGSESFLVLRTKRLMHAINDPSTNIQFWVNSTSRHMYPLGTYFSLRQDKLYVNLIWHGPEPAFRSKTTDCARYCELFLIYILISFLGLVCSWKL